ncbi:hypothetical protein ANRL1_01026 [Anaerolineae bacterium]|nr:hypothetical protein ANRL1_01026 [Anaerolineae bacterium]
MSLLLPHQMLIQNLAGTISADNKRVYISREKALAYLREITGKDFGDDVKAWSQWVGTHKNEFYELMQQKCVKISV